MPLVRCVVKEGGIFALCALFMAIIDGVVREDYVRLSRPQENAAKASSSERKRGLVPQEV